MLPLDAAQELLAFREAAKNPVAIIENSECMTAEQLAGEEPHKKAVKELYEGALVVGSKLYAQPVLPKQPELMSIGELLQRLEEQTGGKWVEESEQPTPMAFDEAWENKGHLFVDNKQYAALFYGLGYKAATAQPVIPDNDAGDLIQRLCGRAQFLRDRGEVKTPELIEAAISALSAQPVSEQPVSKPYKLEIDMDDANQFSIAHLHEIIYGKELIWPEAKLLARFMLDVKQRVSPAPAQESE
ncbi:hypothetical protein ACP6EW_01635 [Hafnia paralvei]|uniref:hypothetical protein n=1 Tax=Hafnia paralvei TaxID=546367 RepID=UPI003CF7DD55